MERKQASDFSSDVLKLFDGYVHARSTARFFWMRAAKYAVGGFTAAAMLESLKPNYALAQQGRQERRPDQDRIFDLPVAAGHGNHARILRAAANASGNCRRAGHTRNARLNPVHRGRRAAPGGGELRGLSAPDALTPVGGYPGGRKTRRGNCCQQDAGKRFEDLFAAAGFLKSRPSALGKIGAVGFCFGGTTVNALAVRIPDLAAAVPFYGGQPPLRMWRRSSAAFLIHYAAAGRPHQRRVARL